MATSIPGGAYLEIGLDGSKSWHDANGKPLDKEAQAQAEQLFAEQATQRADAERLQLMADAQRDPIARAIFAQQEEARAIRASAVPVKKATT